jgi:hypothetical protein
MKNAHARLHGASCVVPGWRGTAPLRAGRRGATDAPRRGAATRTQGRDLDQQGGVKQEERRRCAGGAHMGAHRGARPLSRDRDVRSGDNPDRRPRCRRSGRRRDGVAWRDVHGASVGRVVAV